MCVGKGPRFGPYLGVRGGYLKEIEAEVERLEREKSEREVMALTAAFGGLGAKLDPKEAVATLGAIPRGRKRAREEELDKEGKASALVSSASVVHLTHRPKRHESGRST